VIVFLISFDFFSNVLRVVLVSSHKLVKSVKLADGFEKIKLHTYFRNKFTSIAFPPVTIPAGINSFKNIFFVLRDHRLGFQGNPHLRPASRTSKTL
jgi:hypothetical protein